MVRSTFSGCLYISDKFVIQNEEGGDPVKSAIKQTSIYLARDFVYPRPLPVNKTLVKSKKTLTQACANIYMLKPCR